MKPLYNDLDFTLYQGDSTQLGKGLAKHSIDCVVTSPPYYGLRDYGTGKWVGGIPNCKHEAGRKKTRYDYTLENSTIQDGGRKGTDAKGGMYLQLCPACGAARVDEQIGLEDDVSVYIEKLTAVFSAIRPALAPHATIWVNLGDSYGPRGLLQVPSRFAMAMQDAGFCFRRDVIWFKRNPMPESSKNRPTTTHEYVLMFSLKPTGYYYDWYGVMEKASGVDGTVGDKRLLRSVWDIPTQSYADPHYATFPLELPRRCIAAGCAPYVCKTCTTPIERIVESVSVSRDELPVDHPEHRPARYEEGKAAHGPGTGQRFQDVKDMGFDATCNCEKDWRVGTVLDPFMGSGTTAVAARNTQRHSVGFELSPEYCNISVERMSQLSLLSMLEVA